MSVGEFERPEVTLLVNAWLERRELAGLTPPLRAVVTDLITQERWGTDSIERLHALLDERLSELDLDRSGPADGPGRA